MNFRPFVSLFFWKFNFNYTIYRFKNRIYMFQSIIQKAKMMRMRKRDVEFIGMKHIILHPSRIMLKLILIFMKRGNNFLWHFPIKNILEWTCKSILLRIIQSDTISLQTFCKVFTKNKHLLKNYFWALILRYLVMLLTFTQKKLSHVRLTEKFFILEICVARGWQRNSSSGIF